MKRGVIGLFRFSSKRIKTMKSEKITFEEQQNSIEDMSNNLQQQQQRQSHRKKVPTDWQLMPFHQLCSLNEQIFKQLELQVLKNKMSVGDEKFSSQHLLENPSKQLSNPYWKHIFETFCNLKSIQNKTIEKIVPRKSLSQMYVEEPLQDQVLYEKISKFINTMRHPQKLENIAEPSFCKHLLGLRRELLMRGVDIDRYWGQDDQKVQLLEVLAYRYEFWMDVKQNRGKNSSEEDYIIEKRTIQNPNGSILIQQNWPKVQVTYIARKRKRKQYDLGFITKIYISIKVNNNTHVITIEKKGPGFKQQQKNNQIYSIIDYDGLYNGNPVIKPIFNF